VRELGKGCEEHAFEHRIDIYCNSTKSCVGEVERATGLEMVWKFDSHYVLVY